MTRHSFTLTFVLASMLALGAISLAGCDSSPAPTPGVGAAPPPRPGEDEMKKQMDQFLAKKGKLPKGVVPPSKK